jgi:ABC-type transport system substrate-binding protein
VKYPYNGIKGIIMKKLITMSLIVVVFGGGILFKSKFFGHDKTPMSLAINNPIKSFDPAVVFNDDALFVMAQSLESLYQYHYLKRPFEVIPSLADGMPEISPDGLVYTIKVKKGIKYHNRYNFLAKNRTVTVDDFIWQIKRLAFEPLKSTGAWLFAGNLKGFNEFKTSVGSNLEKFYSEDLTGLEKIDDLTMKVHLKKPDPNLLYFLSMHFTAPVPLEIIKSFNNDLKNIMIGTGPYEYVGFEENKYNFKKFQGFHEEYYPSTGDRYANTEKLLNSSKERLPFIKELEFRVVTGEDNRWKEFIAGNIDILDVPKKQLIKLSDPTSETNRKFKDDGIIVKHFSRQTTRWIGFNMNDPVIGKNLNLRRAIAHIINHDKYIELLTNNTNLKSNSIFNPSIQGYLPEHRLPYSFNVLKAKEYLKKSGYKPGELTLTYSTRGKQAVHHEEANFLKEQFSIIGINLNINFIEFADFLKLGRSGKLQFWTDNWIYDYPDGENLLQLLISKNHPGINKSGYSNPKVDLLYKKLTKTLNKNDRFKIMYEIEEIVEKDLPWVMLMYESTYIIQQKNIKNFRKSFFIRNFIKYLQKT